MQNTKLSVLFTEPGGNAAIELTLVPPEQGWTPEAADYNTSRQEGVQFIEGSNIRIHGNSAYLGRYRLQSNAGAIDVMAAYIAYGQHMYQLAGMAPASSYSSFADNFERTIRGFRQLTDSRILSVQPDRIRIYRARRGETLRGLLKLQNQSRLKVEDLALLNRIDPDQILSAGSPVKLIRMGRN